MMCEPHTVCEGFLLEQDIPVNVLFILWMQMLLAVEAGEHQRDGHLVIWLGLTRDQGCCLGLAAYRAGVLDCMGLLD